MKRWAIIDVLREILAVCGHTIKVEMIWLKGIPETTGIKNVQYEIVMRARFDENTLACVAPINKKYGLKMKQEGDVWIFTKKENGYESVISTSAI